ncbi:MAG TPA: DUF1127 domain-containing protein [Beijerinckiaceae bacterium]|nr:DUF1127 domain-containing protein [Beijerinckiaceae bacterium]
MILSVILARIQTWLKVRASMRELNALSDRELADIGVNRSCIEQVARECSAAH